MPHNGLTHSDVNVMLATNIASNSAMHNEQNQLDYIVDKAHTGIPHKNIIIF